MTIRVETDFTRWRYSFRL